MSESLPSSFYRAEAAWLEPPGDSNYTPENIEKKCEEINNLLENFASGGFDEIEESSHIDQVIKETEILIKKLKDLKEELEEMEENLDAGPEEDVAYESYRRQMGWA